MSTHLDAVDAAPTKGESSPSHVEVVSCERDTMEHSHDDTISPTSRVTIGLLWTILIGMLAVTVFVWNRFDALDERFVTKELFNARMSALEKQIERLEKAIDKQDRR